MTMVEKYNEHAAAALNSVKPHLVRVGAALAGILGNDAHTYGYHLSKARLLGTGKTGDKSLFGAANVPCADDRAGCAIDIGMDWQASGEWLEWVRAERRAGRLAQITQLIGDPDKLPGAPRDIRDAAYADAGTGWLWTEYHGQGHVTWCHVGIGRRHANDEAFGDQLLGGWSATGRIEEDDMDIIDRLPMPQGARPTNSAARPNIAATDAWTLALLNAEFAAQQAIVNQGKLDALLAHAGEDVRRDADVRADLGLLRADQAAMRAELLAAIEDVDTGDPGSVEGLIERMRVVLAPASPE